MFRISRTLACICLVCATSAHAADLPAPLDLHDGLTVASPTAAGLNAAPLAGLRDAVTRGDFPKTNSVLVMRDGKLVYDGYFADGTPSLLNDTRSATKSITSLAVGAAIQDGAIPSQHALAFPYLADLKPFQNDTPDKEAITIEDMLTMSSALDCDDSDDKSPGNEDNMHPQPNWTRWGVDLPTMAGYARDASGLGPWRYCTTNAFLLGQVVQRATHTPIDRYIEKKLLRPLGITKWSFVYSPAHETMTGGGLRLRARDLAKIAWMVTDGGRWKNRQILPKAWIDAALTARRMPNKDQNYGYFFFQRTYSTACGPLPAWYMAGNGGNAIVMIPAMRMAVVVARANYNTHGMHQQTIDLLEKYVLPSLPCAAAP